MVTRAGWSVLVGALATLVVGRVLGLAELAVLGSTGVVLVVAAAALARRRIPQLEIERVVHPARVPVGGRSRVDLVVTNRGHRRTPLLTLHDPVAGTIGARVALAPLAPGDAQAASYRLPTDRRGLVAIGPLTVHRTDAFGLARRSQVVAGSAALTVLPAVAPLHSRGAGTGLDDPLAGLAQRRSGGSGNEDFATLRPYVVGDDLRRIHWASSARSGDLLVRQDDPPWRGHITVVLDARAHRTDPDRFELAVSATASILHAAARQGDRARLVITDGTDTGLVDARAATDTLLERLALVQPHPDADLPDVPADGRIRTGALVLVSGSPTADDVARLTAHRLRFATVRVVVIDPSATGGAREAPPVLGADVEVVRVDDTHPFPVAWDLAGRGETGRGARRRGTA